MNRLVPFLLCLSVHPALAQPAPQETPQSVSQARDVVITGGWMFGGFNRSSQHAITGVGDDKNRKATAIAQIANAMFAIGMQRAAGGGGGGQTLTASISGPDAVNTDWYSTWGAQVSGGYGTIHILLVWPPLRERF